MAKLHVPPFLTCTFLPHVESVPERGSVSFPTCLHLLNKEILKILQLCPVQKDWENLRTGMGPLAAGRKALCLLKTCPVIGKAEHLCFFISEPRYRSIIQGYGARWLHVGLCPELH